MEEPAAGDEGISTISSTPLCLALAGYILFFSCYAVIGFPEWLCRITALNFCPETRVRLTIGIAGLMLAFLSLGADGLALVQRPGAGRCSDCDRQRSAHLCFVVFEVRMRRT